VFLGKTIPTVNTNIIIQAINKRYSSIGHYNILARIGLFYKKSCSFKTRASLWVDK